MDRATRHELKTDRFVLEVGHFLEYFDQHRTMFLRIGGVALALLVIGLAGWQYSRMKSAERQVALGQALRVYNAPVTPTASPDLLTFPTQEARAEAVQQAMQDLAKKYPGTKESGIALYMLGLLAADRNDFSTAEKFMRDAVREGNAETVALAKLSLAEILQGQSKTQEAEKLLKEVMDRPSVMVTKEQATLTLARLYINANRTEEARKLLESMRGDSGAAGRAAISMLGEISQPQ